MVQKVDKAGFEFLKRKISRERGFNCDYYKESVLERRIRNRMRRANINSFIEYAYIEYAELLDRDEEEYNTLIDTLTVNVTEFFRDPSAFKILKNTVIPSIISNKDTQGRKVISVWSAGCASGEEPYSVAILFREFLGDKIEGYHFHINATDIDATVLEKAKAGVYSESQLKNVNSLYLRKYFTKEGNMYRISDDIKKFVRLRKHDLISGMDLKYFDLILCRNVMIYFSRETQEEIFMRFLHALNPSGYLMIGKTETLTAGMEKKLELIDLHERIYRKPLWLWKM